MEIELNEKINNEKEYNLNENNKIELLVEKDITEKSQNNFLQTNLGRVVNTALDIGLKSILPDMIEEHVIDIKDVLLTNGLKEGVNVVIKNAIDFGKSALGIVTGEFENLSQAHTAIKKGGIIDGISNVIDNVVEASAKNNLISKETSKLIKKGKNVILDTIYTNIENNFMKQTESLEKISKYISNWKNYYNIKDMEGMEKEYKKLKKEMNTVMALESTISEARKIENIHNLLKNKGKNYVLSEDENELINIFK